MSVPSIIKELGTSIITLIGTRANTGLSNLSEAGEARLADIRKNGCECNRRISTAYTVGQVVSIEKNKDTLLTCVTSGTTSDGVMTVKRSEAGDPIVYAEHTNENGVKYNLYANVNELLTDGTVKWLVTTTRDTEDMHMNAEYDEASETLKLFYGLSDKTANVLTVVPTPETATVRLDGEEAGTVGIRQIEVPVGQEVTYHVECSGYETITDTVKLAESTAKFVQLCESLPDMDRGELPEIGGNDDDLWGGGY